MYLGCEPTKPTLIKNLGERLRLIRGHAKKLGQDVAKIRDEWLPMEKLREAVKAIQEVVQHLGDLLAQGEAPAKFFEGSHLSRIAGWATKHRKAGGRYRSSGNGLIWEREGGLDEPVRTKGPRAVVMPSLEPINSMREAISATDHVI